MRWRGILSAVRLSDVGCLLALGACTSFVQGEGAALAGSVLLAAFAFGFACLAGKG